jgi:hypothetical protein
MKKKVYILMLIVFAVLVSTSPALADKPVKCATIQDGTITASDGTPLELGYDQYGYNYQAHMFNGTYDSYDRVIGNDTSNSADDALIMKWSDAWLANVDCNGDGKLDRGLVDGVVGGISLGWLINQVNGDYDSDGDGIQDAHFTDFVKIVWTGPGSPLWGQYTVIQEVYNDPVGGYNGLLTKEASPGFGLNDQWTTIP